MSSDSGITKRSARLSEPGKFHRRPGTKAAGGSVTKKSISETDLQNRSIPSEITAANNGDDGELSGSRSGSYGVGGMGAQGMGMGMGGYGMGGYGMGMGMGMGGYGMGGYGMGGYGMGMDGVMAPLMNQLMMVQSLNYTLMSFGQIVQSLGINAGSILQFGQSVLRTLDALAIAIKKSGILCPRTPQDSSTGDRDKRQHIRKRRRAVLVRWTLVVLTMAVTSQVLRILKYCSNASFPTALAHQIIHFFKSFFPSTGIKSTGGTSVLDVAGK